MALNTYIRKGGTKKMGKIFLVIQKGIQDTLLNGKSLVGKSRPILCDPTDCSLPGFSIHGIFQARVLEWDAIAFSDIIAYTTIKYGLSRWLSATESTCQCRRLGFHPWVRKIPWRRKWQPNPVFLPGESHGQRSLVGYSP